MKVVEAVQDKDRGIIRLREDKVGAGVENAGAMLLSEL
jgi:hypothetical protein